MPANTLLNTSGGSLSDGSPNFAGIKEAKSEHVYAGIKLIWDKLSTVIDRLQLVLSDVGYWHDETAAYKANVSTFFGSAVGLGDGNWTLASGDVSTVKYTLIGETMVVSAKLITTSITNTPSSLRMQIPGGFAIKESAGTGSSVAAGFAIGTTHEIVYVVADASLAPTSISIFRTHPASANWANSTNAQEIAFEIAFPIDGR